jgi:hypothetical protein
MNAMRTFLLPSSLLLAALLLNGCASMSENECMTADWESIGYRDGSQGYGPNRLSRHVEACAEFSVRADSQQYEDGRIRGLELFCTGQNGLRLGRQGYSYSGVCPPSLEPAFVRGLDAGRGLYEMDAHMQKLRNEIQQVQAELRREEPPLSDRERDVLLYRLRDLEREYGRSEAELRGMERNARDF